jgi:hypothetical protein
MSRAPIKNPASKPRRYCGPEGLGQEAARALEQSAGAGEGFGGMEEESILHRWAETGGHLIPAAGFTCHKLVSATTSEHEVRYRQADHRAVKRTWPGMFGFVPKASGGRWMQGAARASEYLLRLHLQNELFGDEIRLEGATWDSGPSMIIGRVVAGLSLVISQPWLDASDPSRPHPSAEEIREYMMERDFEPLSGSFFGWHASDLGIVILDAKNDNFVATDHGILPIDLQITEIRGAA